VGDVGAAYTGCRERITALTRGLDAEASAAPVPTCPAWTVHDVVAHVAGVVDDALAGRLEGVATDPWTAAQVDARRGRPVDEILAEWEVGAPAFAGLLDDLGDTGRQAVADVVTHEHDIRTALATPGARDSDAVHIAVGWLSPRFVGIVAERGIALRVAAADGRSWGDADPAGVSLSGEPFELLRAMTGRRSVDQLRQMRWHGDAEAVLPAFTFGPFHPARQPIAE
jgi:uncharacterized protein (TIGR03083 family)